MNTHKYARRPPDLHASNRPLIISGSAFLALIILSLALSVVRSDNDSQPPRPKTILNGRIALTSPRADMSRFIAAHATITLTPKQQDIKKAALKPMPAACCRKSTALECCCPCNLSKSIWGLAETAIVGHGANALEVQAAVRDYLKFMRPPGFDGASCYRGRCDQSAAADGCSGMDATKIVM